MRASAAPRPEQVEAERLRRDYRRFIRAAWPLVDPAPFKGNWHIDCIAEHLQGVAEGQILRLLINQPPRTMKSLNLAVLFPAWLWATNPAFKFMFSSYDAAYANRDSVRCRALIQSPWYQARFPRVQITEDENRITRFSTVQGGHRIATTPAASGGLGDGADGLCADDPQNNKRMWSEAYRKETIRWWRTTWANRLNDRDKGWKIVAMQRLHQGDLSGHILAKESGWTHLLIPQEYSPKRAFYSPLKPKPPLENGSRVVDYTRDTDGTWKDPRTVEGALLWPAHMSKAAIEKLKQEEMGAAEFACQHNQEAAPPGGLIFLGANWRYYRPSERPEKFDNGLLSVDMNFGDAKTAEPSWVVAAAWARVQALFYLLDLIRGLWEYAEARSRIHAFYKATSQRFPATKNKMLIEKKANGAALLSDMRRIVPGVVPFEPSKYGSKEARARAVVPIQEAHQILIPEETPQTPWVTLWKDEHEKFPNSENDDQVDTTTMALLVLRDDPGNVFWIG